MDTGPALAPAHVLADRYVLERVLGAGGMSTVWSAHDQRLGRTVAVKILRPHLSDAHAQRIEREARALARIADPRVVTVLDLDHEIDGTPFLVLEALSGRTLADELGHGPLDADRAIRLAADLLGALGSAHAVGVLHRDVKPANVLVDGDGFRITDFGIASVADEATTDGDLMGTLVYLAPERLDGSAATARSDVFSAAVVLYEALTGSQPFRGASTSDSLARLRAGRFDPLPGDVPAPLAGAIGRALDPDPSRRPADGGAFARSIDALDGAPAGGTSPGRGGPDPTVPVDLGDPTAPIRRHDDRTARIPPPRPVVGSVRAPHPLTRWLSVARRSPRFVFTTVSLLVFVLLLVAAASGGSDSPPERSGEPAQLLDQQLDRLEELGR